MYRERIRKSYDNLSRSYRKVADYVLSHYYEVAFMTAAQLAHAVSVDTTTVVRFSQRLGYNGYPDLLGDVRQQVKEEIYAHYTPEELTPGDPAQTFVQRLEQERQNLYQTRTHASPEQVARVAQLLREARHIALVAEGYGVTAAAMMAQQLRHRGLSAEAVEADGVQRTATLMNLDRHSLVIGISATPYGEEVARAMAYARRQGCATLGVVGSMESPVNRMSDEVLYAPTNAAGPLPSIIALVAVLGALVEIAADDSSQAAHTYVEEFNRAYQFLAQSDERVGYQNGFVERALAAD